MECRANSEAEALRRYAVKGRRSMWLPKIRRVSRWSQWLPGKLHGGGSACSPLLKNKIGKASQDFELKSKIIRPNYLKDGSTVLVGNQVRRSTKTKL